MMGDPAVRCSAVTKRYSDQTVAIHDLTVDLAAHRVHLIIGPNGAGKTTFLRMLSGEMSPSAGSLEILGIDPTSNSTELKRRIGVMPQDALMYKHLTVWEHVYWFTLLKGLSRRRSRQEAERVLDLVAMTDRKNDELNVLSGGMVKAVNLAQALAGEPDLLLLDEPTTGIDPERRRRIWDHVREVCGTQTVIVTTQYLDEATELGDNYLVFHNGRVVHSGDIESTLSRLDYTLKVDAPMDDRIIDMVRTQQIPFELHEGTQRLSIWVKEKRGLMEGLLERDIDLSDVTFSRPILEDAYLDILESADASRDVVEQNND